MPLLSYPIRDNGTILCPSYYINTEVKAELKGRLMRCPIETFEDEVDTIITTGFMKSRLRINPEFLKKLKALWEGR